MGVPAEHAVIIVSPYRPLRPDEMTFRHTAASVGQFDWIEALGMLSNTASRFDYPVIALSNGPLPGQHLQFETAETELMLWILEVSLAYLESEHFNQDTAFVSPDSLINKPFPPMRGFDLGVCVRFDEKYSKRPILNSVQLWPVAGKERLIRFYQKCLAIAKQLPCGGKWGADTKPLHQLLRPFAPGVHTRAEMIRVKMFSSRQILRTILSEDIRAISQDQMPMRHDACVIDFKGWRKQHMKRFYEVTHESS